MGRDMSAKPRLGVVITELGIPSEVWMVRQCLGFRRVEPVLFAWGERAGAGDPPALERHLFAAPFPAPEGPWRRLQARAGLARARLPDAAARDDIRRTLGGAGLDGVLCHFLWTAIPVVEALGGALPVAAQAHGRDASALLAHADYRAALRRTLPRLDALAVVGGFQRDLLAPFGPPARTAVIPCGAPTALFAARPLPLRAPGAPIRFVSVGRLSAEKGVLESLEAFERVARAHPAEWTVIGDGPLRGALETAVARSPAGAKVRLTGALGPEAVADELSRAHVFVQHSREAGGWIEGFGVTLTEAGAAGLPRVASAFGGIPDQVTDGRDGLLFPPDDVAAQAAAMARLAEDEALRRAMGAAARTRAAEFDSDLMAGRLEDFLIESFTAARAPTPDAAHV